MPFRSGLIGDLFGVHVAGRQLVDTPLINPHDNRMVPNTFEAVTLVSLPDKDRKYDYAVGYIWNMKQQDSNDFNSMSEALAGADVLNPNWIIGANVVDQRTVGANLLAGSPFEIVTNIERTNCEANTPT